MQTLMRGEKVIFLDLKDQNLVCNAQKRLCFIQNIAVPPLQVQSDLTECPMKVAR